MNIHEQNLVNIRSWDEFFTYANSLTEKQKGDLFERLTYLILKTKPEYLSVLKGVWLSSEGIPKDISKKINFPGTDEGIDLVAETTRGEYWAIQCRFKGQNESPTYKQLSTFTYLSNTYCKNISFALLVHTGEKGVRKKKLLGERYGEIGLDFWLNLSPVDWANVHRGLKKNLSRPVVRSPRKHQSKAIQFAKTYFQKKGATRGRLVMPCGTGKSLTAFWIANSLKAESVIVAVPSLWLIKQTVEDWTREFVALNEKPLPNWLVICSDESAGNVEKDDFVSDIYSLGIPTTTDVDVILSFLKEKHKGRKIIFTTYQSSNRLAEAAKMCGFKFDFAIFDEAHKTVGEKSKIFTTILSDNNILITKRMFMTATERVVKGLNDEVFSMDNETIYGSRFFQLTFKKAIHSRPPIISDYKILTIAITSEEIRQLVDKNKLVTDKIRNIEEEEAQTIAAAIALRKAILKYGIKHAISFHQTINRAHDFFQLNNRLNKIEVDGLNLSSYHISSKKSAGKRAQLMKDFKDEQLALMTNARCLTEGVDVPAIDCVLFADPKNSIVDIVQASGRALRPNPGKRYGYIMIPLIVPDGMQLQEFIESTRFRQVGKIITALSTQDETIAEQFRITDTGRQGGGKIIIEGNIPVGLNIDFSDFAEKISDKIWDKVGKVNWRSFQEAKHFAHSLNLKNRKQWEQYCLSEKKPKDIPGKPERVYKHQGWIGVGDWLGTGAVAKFLRKYRTFNEAKKYVHSLSLRNQREWSRFCKSGKKPDNIPSDPYNVYKDKGWITWGDWLGTAAISPMTMRFYPFIEARKYIHTLNLKNEAEWQQFYKSQKRPKFIPTNPRKVYKNEGWVSLGDWLGTGKIATQKMVYKPFNEAREFVHSLNLKSQNYWRLFCNSEGKPVEIPADPYRTYKEKGWLSWGDWLGTGRIADQLKDFMRFKQARKYVHSLNLKNQNDWVQFCKSEKKPVNLPAGPGKVYKNEGWKGFGDWLGTGTLATRFRKSRSFLEARQYVHSLGLKNREQWFQFCKSKEKPKDIPTNPHRVYKDIGWVSMGDWLGTGTIAPFLRKYQSFNDAKKYVHTLSLKNRVQWAQFCKSGKKPSDIPNAPNVVYKDSGWIGMGDWLGTGTIAPFLKKFRTFVEARKYVQSLKLKNRAQWTLFCKSGKKPIDIPTEPHRTYKDSGWQGFEDWLDNKL